MCDPEAIGQNHPGLYPALIITWGTDGIMKHPGETLDAGSGYMPSPGFVITAAHIGDLIRRDMQVRDTQRKMQHVLSVHDPRLGLTWRVLNERPIVDSDIAIYEVTPLITPSTPKEAFEEWEAGFHAPAHRGTELQPGEEIVIRGFSSIRGTLVEDSRSDGGKRRIAITAEGNIGAGTVTARHALGYITLKHSCVEIGGLRIKGNNSGGPAFDSKGRIVGIASASPEGEGCHSWITDWHPYLGGFQAIGKTQGTMAINVLHKDRPWEVRIFMDESV